MAATASEVEPVLPQSPFATLGTLVHKGLEDGLSREDILRKAVAPSTRVASAVSREGTVSLVEAVGRSNIRVRIARMPLRREHDEPPAGDGSPGSRSEYRVTGFDGEVVGVIDHVRWSQDEVTITDFKTGAIRDEMGDVREAYFLQLIAYGSLLRESGETRAIRLRLIGIDAVFDSRLEESHELRVRDLIMRGISRLPRGRAEGAENLATTGLHCWECGFRPRCAAYLRSAHGLWLEDPASHSGFVADVWGVIEETERFDGNWLVKIRDADERRNSVFGVPDHLLEDPRIPSSEVYFFGIRPLRSSTSASGHNFEIVARKPHLSAHGATVFVKST